MSQAVSRSVDLTKVLRPFENKWVAMSLDRKKVLGAGQTLTEVQKKLGKSKGKYLFHKVLPFNISYLPTS